jgi:hypothetical protein
VNGTALGGGGVDEEPAKTALIAEVADAMVQKPRRESIPQITESQQSKKVKIEWTKDEKARKKAEKKERRRMEKLLEEDQAQAILQEVAQKKEDAERVTEALKIPVVKETPVPVPTIPKPKAVSMLRRGSSMSGSPVPIPGPKYTKPSAVSGMGRTSSMSESPVPFPVSTYSKPSAVSKVGRSSSMSESPVPVPSFPRPRIVLNPLAASGMSIDIPKVEAVTPSKEQDGKVTSGLTAEEKALRKASKKERRAKEKGASTTRSVVASVEDWNLTKKQKKAAKKAKLGGRSW